MKIFEPFKIGNMEIKNRIVVAPMTVDYANPDETPSERHIAYYSERAKGGAGLITLEVVTVDGDHRYQQNSLGLYNDSLIAPHKKLVDAIHAHGAKVQPQLSHTGPESLGGFFKGIQPVGPSVVRTATTLQVCRELAIDEIPRLVSMYGDAAVRARAAGYDGVELHAAHSYMLLGSFLSPLRNHRTDAYKGSKPEGRMKLLLEVLADIRSKVGKDFPITLQLSGDLPASLHWVEVDHRSLIEGKDAQLSTEVAACSIERVGLDLADHVARREVFDRIWATSTRAMVLTEGALGALSVDEAGGLADDLRARPGCESWVIDYFSARLLATYQKHQPHPNVPVRFDPPSWEAFFTQHGWRIKEIRFLGEESERLHRPVPLSRLDKVMRLFTSRPLRDMGYASIERFR